MKHFKIIEVSTLRKIGLKIKYIRNVQNLKFKDLILRFKFTVLICNIHFYENV